MFFVSSRIGLKNHLLEFFFFFVVFIFLTVVSSAQITGLYTVDTCEVAYLSEADYSEQVVDSAETNSKSTTDTVSASSLDEVPPTADSSIIPKIITKDSPHTLGVFDMFTNLPGDWYRWSKKAFTTDNIPLIAALGVMTAGMVITDYELWQPAKKSYERSQTVRDVSDAFVGVGDGKFQFGLAVGFGLYGVIFSDSKALRTASQVTEVILACGGVVQLLKHLTGRESPVVATTRTGAWALLPNQIEYHKHVPHYDAFPSGHIATAMATMIVISENYPDQKWIRYIGYPAVALVGVGLTTTSIHWVSDFPLGLALGYSFGMLIAHQFDTPQESTASSRTSSILAPTAGLTMMANGAPALQLSWQW